MDQPNTQSGPRRIEVIDKRERDEQREPAPAEAQGSSFSEATPQEASAQRLRERDDAERWLTGGAHNSSALGSEQDASPDVAAKAQEYLELAQRKEAEFRNYRAQERQRVEDARHFAVEGILHDLFPVLDGLAQALRSVEGSGRDDDPLLVGLRNTAKALEKALLKHGVEKIDEAGVDFDSELHQPVQVEVSDQVESDKVIEVYVAGYRLHGKVLKPAMVKVLQPG